jgi:hypothetical protein
MWPTPQDYNESIQNPRQCFRDQDLIAALPVLTPLGLPKPVSGAFASVYQMTDERGRQFAVRCFLRDVPDQAARYAAITAKLNEAALPYTVPFEYLSEGIQVGGNWYPILKMEWVSGQSLIEWLMRRVDDSASLERLSKSFVEMMTSLRAHGIAHGDLQHGNIIVADEKLKLVDYDGMFVPSMSGFGAPELGHRHFQHPSRSSTHFGDYLDNFSAWSIYTSLFCLSLDPTLWRSLGAGEECLLFRQEDYVAPTESVAFRLLENHQLLDIQRAARKLRLLRDVDVSRLPPLGEPVEVPVDDGGTTRPRPIPPRVSSGGRDVREALRVAIALKEEQPQLRVVDEEELLDAATAYIAAAAAAGPTKVPVHVLPRGGSTGARRAPRKSNRDAWVAVSLTAVPIVIFFGALLLPHSGSGPATLGLQPATMLDWENQSTRKYPMFATARSDLENGNTSQAILEFEEQAKTIPPSDAALVSFEIGKGYHDEHKYAEAQKQFADAERLTPAAYTFFLPELQWWQADISAHENRPHDAYFALNAIDAKNDESVQARITTSMYSLAKALLEQRDPFGFEVYSTYLTHIRDSKAHRLMTELGDIATTLEDKGEYDFAFKIRKAQYEGLGPADASGMISPETQQNYRLESLRTAARNRELAGDEATQKLLETQIVNLTKAPNVVRNRPFDFPDTSRPGPRVRQ